MGEFSSEEEHSAEAGLLEIYRDAQAAFALELESTGLDLLVPSLESVSVVSDEDFSSRGRREGGLALYLSSGECWQGRRFYNFLETRLLMFLFMSLDMR